MYVFQTPNILDIQHAPRDEHLMFVVASVIRYRTQSGRLDVHTEPGRPASSACRAPKQASLAEGATITCKV